MLRRDEYFNKFITQIDEMKVKKNIQSSYLNISELESNTEDDVKKYEIFLGCDKQEAVTDDELNNLFAKLQNCHAINSRAVRLEIFFNESVKIGDKLKVITEFIYYHNNQKVPMYYLTLLSTM